MKIRVAFHDGDTSLKSLAGGIRKIIGFYFGDRLYKPIGTLVYSCQECQVVLFKYCSSH